MGERREYAGMRGWENGGLYLEWIGDSHWMDGVGRGRAEFVREGGEREARFR